MKFWDICPAESNQNSDSSELTEIMPATANLNLGQPAGIVFSVTLMVDSSELADLLSVPAIPCLSQLAAIAVSSPKPRLADQPA